MEDKIRTRLLERIYEALDVENRNYFSPAYAKTFSEVYVTLYGQFPSSKEQTPPPAPGADPGEQV